MRGCVAGSGSPRPSKTRGFQPTNGGQSCRHSHVTCVKCYRERTQSKTKQGCVGEPESSGWCRRPERRHTCSSRVRSHAHQAVVGPLPAPKLLEDRLESGPCKNVLHLNSRVRLSLSPNSHTHCTHRVCSSLPKCLQCLGPAGAKNQELNPGLPHGRQGPDHLSHHCCLPY